MKSEFGLAIHAIVFLNHHKNELISSEILAKNTCTNSARIRKVLSKLRKANIISAKEGIDGGYIFNGDANKITLKTICDSLKIQIITPPRHSADIDINCLISSGMGTILEEVHADLTAAIMQQLNSITIQSIENKLFYKE